MTTNGTLFDAADVLTGEQSEALAKNMLEEYIPWTSWEDVRAWKIDGNNLLYVVQECGEEHVALDGCLDVEQQRYSGIYVDDFDCDCTYDYDATRCLDYGDAVGDCAKCCGYGRVGLDVAITFPGFLDTYMVVERRESYYGGTYFYVINEMPEGEYTTKDLCIVNDCPWWGTMLESGASWGDRLSVLEDWCETLATVNDHGTYAHVTIPVDDPDANDAVHGIVSTDDADELEAILGWY